MKHYSEELVEAMVGLARAEAELSALRRQALGDTALVEALRARAWVRAAPSRCRLGEGDAILTPDGWPDGVDPDTYVWRQVENGARRAALMEELAALDD